MTELFQSGAHVIIAEAFKAAGKWYVNEISEKIKTDGATFVLSGFQRFVDAGLGRIEIVEFIPEKMEIHFRIWINIFAEIYQDHGTYCFGIEAYVSGVIEQLIGKVPVIRKTKCLGKGDPYGEGHLSLPSTKM
jgi:predicted hydrocarbon binding protein